MITKTAPDEKGLIQVTFELSSALWVERVNLVGAFNDWDTTATPMRRCGANGTWRVTMELAAGQRHAFRYLVDGKEWRNDWHADDYQENPYGSSDSVVDLTAWNPGQPQAGQHSATEQGPWLEIAGETDEE